MDFCSVSLSLLFHPFEYPTNVISAAITYMRGLIGLWLYKENNKLRDWKMYLRIPPWAPHAYNFVALTSLTHPRKNSFGCAANRKIGNRESQTLISTTTYVSALDHVRIAPLMIKLPSAGMLQISAKSIWKFRLNKTKEFWQHLHNFLGRLRGVVGKRASSEEVQRRENREELEQRN
jgi:hypothetical protein